MTVVFLTRDLALSKSQMRMIHDHHPLSAVVYETPPPLSARIRKRFKMRSPADFVQGAIGRASRVATKAVGLGPRRRSTGLLPPPVLPSGVPLHVVSSINAPETRTLLDTLAPDVVLVRGTSLIRDEILGGVPLALNVHAGLSPYYRGTHCTEWALLNWDPYNIGVTVHRVTKAIDGGAIYGQSRVQVDASDTVDSIEEKICFEGGKLFISALDALAAGKSLELQEQHPGVGTLRLGLHWDALCESRVHRLTSPEIMAAMLMRPSKREQPIVERMLP